MELPSPKKYLLVPKVVTESPNTFKLIMFSLTLVMYICYIISFTGLRDVSNQFASADGSKTNGGDVVANTDLSHIVFAVIGSGNSWKSRRPYVDLWWRSNRTRGVLWLDHEPSDNNETWPETSPPFRVSADVSRFKEYDRHGMPFAIRMTRVILETFDMNFTNVRWFVMADDDTVLFVDNLVEVLQRYDHRKYHYMGGTSECVAQNAAHSFGMAFGGGGIVMSYPLVRDLSKILDGCIMRYPDLYGDDHIFASCISELGVSLTRLPGFHQFDLHGDISGYLSAHPPAPLLSFHHIDTLDPIFPNATRDSALRRLMKAVKADHSRTLQQTVCYDLNHNRSFSVAWGYSVHVYEKLHAPALLEIPIKTFQPWNGNGNPPFMFNVRPRPDDPCLVPHVFFFEDVGRSNNNHSKVTTNYVKKKERGMLIPCGNNSAAELIKEILVYSPVQPFDWGEGKRECCTVTQKTANVTEIEIRSCVEGEVPHWSSLS